MMSLESSSTSVPLVDFTVVPRDDPVVRWTLLDPAAEPITNLGPPPIDQWLQSGEARIVKDSAHRSVYRVTAHGLDFYVKHDRGNDMRARLRRFFLGTKAEREARKALEIARRGIDTIAPLALGTVVRGKGRGESFLITRTIPQAVSVTDLISQSVCGRIETRTRREFAYALGRFVACLHNAGVFHQDFHCGNILVTEGDSQPRFFLIDVLDLRLRRRVSWRECLANLAMLNRWLRYKTSRTDRRAFFDAYRKHLRVARPDDRIDSFEWRLRAREVEQATADSNADLWQRLGRRCRRTGRHFREIRCRDLRGRAVADIDSCLLQSLLADPDRWFDESSEAVEVLKASRSSQVVAFRVQCSPHARRYVWKRFRIKSWKEAIAGCFRPGAVWRSWVNGHALRARGLPTPRPLLVLFKYRRGLCKQGYLLFDRVEAEGNLHDALKAVSSQPRHCRQSLLRRYIEDLANLIREMHDRGVMHRDLKPANVMYIGAERSAEAQRTEASISLDTRFCLVDLVGVSCMRRVPFSSRVKNLARLNAGMLVSPLVSRTDRLRFLYRYLRAALHGGADWKRWWRAIDQATRAKVTRNARRGRVLA